MESQGEIFSRGRYYKLRIIFMYGDIETPIVGQFNATVESLENQSLKQKP